MPFTDPIVAEDELVRDQIRSSDYVEGVSGWIIRRDGSAEFNQGTFRGLLQMVDAANHPYVQIDENGVQVSATESSTSHGYLKLDRDPDSTDTVRIVFYPADIPINGREGQIWATGGNANYESDSLIIDSPSHGGRAWARLILRSSDLTNNPTALLSDADRVIFSRAEGSVGMGAELTLNNNGTGGLYAVQGGTKQGWVSPTLNSPFTNRGGSYRPFRVRQVASPPNGIQVDGHINVNGAANGAVLTTLSTPYRPIDGKIASAPISGVPGGQVPVIELSPDGTVRLWGHNSTSVISFGLVLSRD